MRFFLSLGFTNVSQAYKSICYCIILCITHYVIIGGSPVPPLLPPINGGTPSTAEPLPVNGLLAAPVSPCITDVLAPTQIATCCPAGTGNNNSIFGYSVYPIAGAKISCAKYH
jgi:hypothetical protein